MSLPVESVEASLDQLRDRALASGVRPRKYGSWYVAFAKFRNQRTYLQTILAIAFGTPILYMVAMGLGLGKLISANLGQSAFAGVDYLTFVAPALLMSAAVGVASNEMTYTIFGGFKWNPIFHAMYATPLSAMQIINGVMISVLARLAFTSAIYYGVLLIFDASPSPWGWAMILISVLTAVAFNSLIMAYTASLESDTGQISLVLRFVVMPLTLFSGTLFPLETLPGAAKVIGWISPLWHGTQLGRVVSYQMDEPLALTAIHVGYLLALAVVGWVWTGRIAARRLSR